MPTTPPINMQTISGLNQQDNRPRDRAGRGPFIQRPEAGVASDTESAGDAQDISQGFMHDIESRPSGHHRRRSSTVNRQYPDSDSDSGNGTESDTESERELRENYHNFQEALQNRIASYAAHAQGAVHDLANSDIGHIARRAAIGYKVGSAYAGLLGLAASPTSPEDINATRIFLGCIGVGALLAHLYSAMPVSRGIIPETLAPLSINSAVNYSLECPILQGRPSDENMVCIQDPDTRHIQIFDRASLQEWLRHNNTHPVTRREMTLDMIKKPILGDMLV